MKFLILLSLTFSLSICYSQNTITGKILDKETKQGLPFANIVYMNLPTEIGGYSDSLGNYSINAIDADVKISCIGYQTLTIKKGALLPSKIITLTPISYELDMVKIAPKKTTKSFRLGYFKPVNKTIGYGSIGFAEYNNTYNNYVATYIENPKKDTSLFISKLLYNLTNKPKHLAFIFERLRLSTTPCEATRLRVHLFTSDMKTKKPDKELLTKSIIIQNDCKSNGDLIIDISDQNIRMPADGIFVALEYIDLIPKTKKIYYPFYLTSFNKIANTYESYQQENWIKINHGSQAQFGIEVIK